jgi:hypothetical protein
MIFTTYLRGSNSAHYAGAITICKEFRRIICMSSRIRSTHSTFNWLPYAIAVLTLLTAGIHIYLAVDFMAFDMVFILNGLGYLTLLSALYAPLPALRPYRPIIRWIFIIYTAVTLVLWIIIGGTARTPIAFFVKAVEILLIISLWLEGQGRR